MRPCLRPAIVTALALTVAPTAALACGGCFSMAPPPGQAQNQIVVQNAERVLFLRKGNTSTVWIEVKYQGQTKDFGWVLPLPKVPQVGVGSRVLFDVLDQRTAPVFKTSLWPVDENCRDPRIGCETPKFSSDAIGSTDAPKSVDATASAPDGNSGGAVSVVAEGQTGPYDYAVVKSIDAGPLLAWLNGHGYATSEKALAILQMHVSKGDVFLAVKLQNGQGIERIRPLVVQMEDAEPCVPLRLTSIAAVQDMAVTVLLAGPGRAVPKNFLHVVPNPLRLNWFSGASNYPQVLAAAIDEAGGHAFATEFAQPGATSMTDLFAILPDSKAFAGATDVRALAVALFNVFGATPLNQEIAATIDQHAGLTNKFKSMNGLGVTTAVQQCGAVWAANPTASCVLFDSPCTDQSPDACDLKTFSITGAEAAALPVDATGLVLALEKDYVQPLQAAQAALVQAKMVTRLALRISPEEMDRDPVFAFHAKLPNVSPVHEATFRRVCPNGWLPATQTRLTIPEMAGTWVFEGRAPNDGGAEGNNAADARFAKAPLALRVEVLEEAGAPRLVAPAQVGLVDVAIAGALPGKPSLPKDLQLQPSTIWQAPGDNLPAQALGPWPKPAACTARTGWTDGKPAPLDLVPPSADAIVFAGDAESDAGAAVDSQKGEVVTARPAAPAGKSGCAAAAAGSATPFTIMLTLLSAAGLTRGRRRT